ncbi:ABC transporter permease [Aquimarina sp. 2201CG5-10]|uniref:ABC transporter permease n=1 Tax=Aquimarina callyspongiae TaxID=3098150 RepID=UPI002AB572B8|nr:FtsX-like permease family protein [Aquimarina sp. 2201CG5-10]MDY8137533.1 FtsX-like permease family protein [Aquimarina sp. 2201CG5-10]
MLINYLKIAWRNLLKNKVFSFINIISLSIGLSASFVIGLMVYYDFTFDQFHEGGDRIYRITSEFTSPQGNFYNSGVPVPLSQALRDQVSGLETITPFITSSPLNVKNDITDQTFKNTRRIIYTDKNYFGLFRYEWLAGSPQNTLSNPNEVVLTESRLKKYFPSLTPQQAIGKTLTYNEKTIVKIIGVVANFKERSDFIFEEFISIKTADQIDTRSIASNTNWGNTNSSSQLFIKVKKNVALTIVQNQLDALAKKHEDKEMASMGQHKKFQLQPLSDLHFSPKYAAYDFSSAQASKSALISIIYVAVFLLLLGCINFINLNTAQAAQRNKEIGIRKTLGGSKKQLIFQFLSETFLLTLFATLISLLLSVWLLEVFSDFIPKGISIELLLSPGMLLFLGILILVVTFLSGFYPALILSQFNPISVLKNRVLPKSNKSTLRKSLTVFQFVVAQVFIIATILVGKQINYLVNKDMGFKTEAIAYIGTPWKNNTVQKREIFNREIQKLPQITTTSLAGSPPASPSYNTSAVTYFDGKKEIYTDLQLLYGDQHYLDLYNIQLLAGRKQLNDTIREYVINETYMNLLGIKTPEEAIGKFLKNGKNTYPIVGVMKDFNQRSLRSEIKPMALVGDWYRNQYPQFDTLHFLLQKQQDENWSETIASIEDVWKTIYPDARFEVKFMDETVEKFYKQEYRISMLLNWATGLSIIISCLGLFGLVLYTTQRRTKEIGIRKILGASLMKINMLLCSEFVILLGIAFIIAIPIAWYGLHNWLQEFAYKTSISWWIFVFSGAAMLTVALVIMSIKTIAAAMSNPIKSLRTE